jgi:glycosyltransferase involved in cell wall biosynthesis
VVAEAMACGRAVVVNGSGGVAEFVQPGTDVLAAPPADPGGLAEQIARLSADGSLRRELGRRARVSAERQFLASRAAGEILSLYEAARSGSRDAA